VRYALVDWTGWWLVDQIGASVTHLHDPISGRGSLSKPASAMPRAAHA
jgi:hypothetical protein